MRIDGWQIEGFGVFYDWEVRGLSDGLTVFLGPNEAGKSTLLAFLRGALFGFPGRRSRLPQYPPLRGGRHGGRLMLCGPQGEVTIERVVARKNGLRVNGCESDGRELQALLGGADENVFCSVFAFSLSEMQSFEWLKAEQVRERIFSAGISGAGASARRVIETLEAEASALYRTRGSSRVKELLEQIDQAERRWKTAQDEADRFPSLEEEVEKWNARAVALAAEEEELRRRQLSVETLLDLWSELEQAREQLGALDPVRGFPIEPEAQLAVLTGRVAAARSVAQRLEEEQPAKQRLRALLTSGLQDRLAFISDRVEELHGRLALHQERLEALASARCERDSRSNRWYALSLIIGACVAFAGGWLTARGAASSGLAAVLAGVGAAIVVMYQRIKRSARLGATVARMEKEIADWEQPVREWAGSSKFAQALIPEFLDLRERCRKDRDLRTKLVSLDEAMAETRRQLESAQREVAAAEEALGAFLRESGAEDEADFQGRLRLFRNRQRLSELIEDREARIAAVEATPSSGSAQEWRDESSRLREALSKIQAQRDEAIGEQRLAEAALQRIAESTAVPVIKAELEWLRSELATAIREWRVATLAKELVGRTLQEFTRTRQPAVLEEASAALCRVTAGAYKRVLQDEEGESLVVVAHDAQCKRPEELSRGTAEQLYLCLRLGLAAEFARRTAALPLIMDDVLVNFDPQRANAVARELSRFSAQHQVLIFTCHPETACLFTEAAPGANVIRMERYGESPFE